MKAIDILKSVKKPVFMPGTEDLGGWMTTKMAAEYLDETRPRLNVWIHAHQKDDTLPHGIFRPGKQAFEDIGYKISKQTFYKGEPCHFGLRGDSWIISPEGLISFAIMRHISSVELQIEKAYTSSLGQDNQCKSAPPLDNLSMLDSRFDLITYHNEQFGDLRTLRKDDIVWFLGRDVADMLEYQNGSRDIHRHVEEEDMLTAEVIVSGQRRNMIFINESGLYSLILSSHLPNAKQFKHWVTSEVLPSIREHGSYIAPAAESTDEEQFERGVTAILNKIDRLTKEKSKLAEENEKLLEEMNLLKSRLLINDLVQKYAAAEYRRRLMNKSHNHIDLLERCPEFGVGLSEQLNYLNPDELPNAVKIAVDMCSEIGVNSKQIAMEAGVKLVEGGTL